MFSANLNYEQTFVLNDLQVSGINNFNGSLDVPQKSINILGLGHSFPLVNGPPSAEVNFNRYFIGEDSFLKYTGDQENMFGGITYRDVGSSYSTFSFESGYLRSHSISCSLGRVPQTSTSVSVFGNIGGDVVDNLIGETIGLDANSESEELLFEDDSAGQLMVEVGNNEIHPSIQIPNQGSIEIECHGHSTNRVTDFQYSIVVDRTPMYVVGKKFPLEVHTNYPIKINASFTLDVDDYNAFTFKQYLVSPKEKEIKIILKDSVTNNEIQRYLISNARLTSQSIGSDSDRPLSVNLRYEGYINKN